MKFRLIIIACAVAFSNIYSATMENSANTIDAIGVSQDSVAISEPLLDAGSEQPRETNSEPFLDASSETLHNTNSASQENFQIDTAKYEIKPARIAVIGGSTILAYTAAWYWLFRDGWWDESSSFHFEPRRNDFGYATNLDKFGHFYTGVMFGEAFTFAYDWAGVSPFYSTLFAGATVSFSQILVELKDGFSPYGYSFFDAAAGTLGGFYAMAHRFVPAMKYVDYKFTYWKNSNAYWDLKDAGAETEGVITDDYPNQYHWLSFKINKMLSGQAKQYYPDFLAIAIGLGITDGRYVYDDFDKGKYEFYLSLDYDFEAIFKPQKTWAKNLITILNHIKFPAPAVRLRPNAKFFPLMPWQGFSFSF